MERRDGVGVRKDIATLVIIPKKKLRPRDEQYRSLRKKENQHKEKRGLPMYILKLETKWCTPCRHMSKILTNIQEVTGVEVIVVDVEEHPEIAEKYDVMSVPTLILMEGDEEIQRFVGLTPEHKIIDALMR